jgi:hypothetical protein
VVGKPCHRKRSRWRGRGQPLKRSFPGHGTWSQATLVNRAQTEKAPPPFRVSGTPTAAGKFARGFRDEIDSPWVFLVKGEAPAVSEPASVLLFASGLAGRAGMRRKS